MPRERPAPVRHSYEHGDQQIEQDPVQHVQARKARLGDGERDPRMSGQGRERERASVVGIRPAQHMARRQAGAGHHRDREQGSVPDEPDHLRQRDGEYRQEGKGQKERADPGDRTRRPARERRRHAPDRDAGRERDEHGQEDDARDPRRGEIGAHGKDPAEQDEGERDEHDGQHGNGHQQPEHVGLSSAHLPLRDRKDRRDRRHRHQHDRERNQRVQMQAFYHDRGDDRHDDVHRDDRAQELSRASEQIERVLERCAEPDRQHHESDAQQDEQRQPGFYRLHSPLLPCGREQPARRRSAVARTLSKFQTGARGSLPAGASAAPATEPGRVLRLAPEVRRARRRGASRAAGALPAPGAAAPACAPCPTGTRPPRRRRGSRDGTE